MEIDLLYWIQEYIRVPMLDPIWAGITTLGNKGAIWIVFTLVCLFINKKRYTGIAMLSSLLLCVLVVNITLKPLVMRIRPYEVANFINIYIPKPHDFSFPSGHTAASFAAAWAFFRMEKGKFRYGFLFLAILISFSRMYFFVHYPTDVGISLILGIAFAEIGVWISSNIKEKNELGKIEK